MSYGRIQRCDQCGKLERSLTGVVDRYVCVTCRRASNPEVLDAEPKEERDPEQVDQ